MYAILGVPDTATQDEIEAAYQAKLQQTHPDAGGSAEAFCAVQEAYRALTDSTLPMRRQLDTDQESKTLVMRRPDGRVETQKLWLRSQPDGGVRILSTSQWSGTAAAPAKTISAPSSRCGTGSAAEPDVVLGSWSPLPTE